MPPVRKLVIPTVLTFVVLGTTAVLFPSCGDDDEPMADGQAEADAPRDAGEPDLPLV